MPWEFLAGYAAEKAIDTLLFSEEQRQQLFNVFWRHRGIAERYLELSSDELLQFYENQEHLTVGLAGKRYVLPVSQESNDTTTPSNGQLDCVLESEPYRLDPFLTDYTAPVLRVVRKDKNTFDGRVVRLSGIRDNHLVLQEASYYDGVATNFAMDHKPKGRLESLRELLHSDQQSLSDFDSSPLVNHLGAVCMIETCDGMLVVQRRSREVTNRGGTLSASVSGAVNWTDVQSINPPYPLEELGGAAFRESFEELHVKPHDLQFLGLLREYLRGGKPELYYYAKTREPFREISKAWLHAEGKHESTGLEAFELHSHRLESTELSRDRLKDRLTTILDTVGKQANLTLVAGIILTGKYLLSHAL